MSVSDFETAGEASNATCDSVVGGTITAAAIYETVPVKNALDKAAPTDKGATVEVLSLVETPSNFKSLCICEPSSCHSDDLCAAEGEEQSTVDARCPPLYEDDSFDSDVDVSRGCSGVESLTFMADGFMYD